MIRRVVEPRDNALPIPSLTETARRERPALDARARVRLLRAHRARPLRELPGGVALRAGASCARTSGRVYAFARSADDFADEARYEGRRAEALGCWEDQLERCFHGEAEHPVFIALRDTIEKRDIPIPPLKDMLTAFRMDLSVQPLRDVRSSCAATARTRRIRSGAWCSTSSTIAIRRCTATPTNVHGAAAHQLLAGRRRRPAEDRIYLPEEDLQALRRHRGRALRAQRARRSSAICMRFEVARARSLFERGRPLIDKVGSDLGFELAMIWNGGMTILDKIEAVDYDVFTRRPTLNAADKARMVARAATQRWPQWSSR